MLVKFLDHLTKTCLSSAVLLLELSFPGAYGRPQTEFLVLKEGRNGICEKAKMF